MNIIARIIMTCDLKTVNLLFKHLVIMCNSKVQTKSFMASVDDISILPGVAIKPLLSDIREEEESLSIGGQQEYKNIPFYHHFKSIESKALDQVINDNTTLNYEKNTFFCPKFTEFVLVKKWHICHCGVACIFLRMDLKGVILIRSWSCTGHL